MRGLVASVAVVAALVAAGVAAAAASAPTPPCGAASAQTLAVGRFARVYAVGSRVYGCASGDGGRQFALGTRSQCVRSVEVQAVAVAGRLAAYGSQSCGVDTGSTVVRVRRLTDGRTLFTHPAASPTGPENYTTVSAIATDRSGDVAWVSRTSSIVRHTVTTAVYAARATTVRQLDVGAAIVPGSLRLTPTTVIWRNGGRSRSARL